MSSVPAESRLCERGAYERVARETFAPEQVVCAQVVCEEVCFVVRVLRRDGVRQIV